MAYENSISNLKPDDKVTMHFHGNPAEGRESFLSDTTFISFYTVDGQRQAMFGGFTAYKENGRWRTGEDGDLITVHEVRKDLR